jgi:hypothetical protein
VVEVIPPLTEEVTVLRERQLAAITVFLEEVAAIRVARVSLLTHSFETSESDQGTSHRVGEGAR